MAGWLYRNLTGVADEIVVCDPRRNAHIAKDGDKDDAIDAEKGLPPSSTISTAAVICVLCIRVIHRNTRLKSNLSGCITAVLFAELPRVPGCLHWASDGV